MTTIDANGDVHRGPGSPDGGQFAGKQNSKPASPIRAESSAPEPTARVLASPTMTDLGGYSLSGFRSMRGEETPAFEGDLKIDGTTVGRVYSDGRGGAPMIYWAGRAEREAAEAWLLESGMDEETFAFKLGEDADFAKDLKRSRAKKTITLMLAEDVAAGSAVQPDGRMRFGQVKDALDLPEAIRLSPAVAKDFAHYSHYWDGAAWAPLHG